MENRVNPMMERTRGCADDIIFTPDVIEKKIHKLDLIMMIQIRSATISADCVLFVVDACNLIVIVFSFLQLRELKMMQARAIVGPTDRSVVAKWMVLGAASNTFHDLSVPCQGTREYQTPTTLHTNVKMLTVLADKAAKIWQYKRISMGLLQRRYISAKFNWTYHSWL